jgi:PKD domain-containing protein
MRALVLFLTLVFAAFPAAARAEAPPNDNFADARLIEAGSLPYSDSVDSSEATTEAAEPAPCGGFERSVWYSLTPAQAGVIQIDSIGSSTFNVLTVYTGASLGTLGSQGCASSGSAVNLRADAGVTYHIQIRSFGSLVRLNARLVAPPSNDDFENATVIDPGSLPFNNTQSALAATRQTGEPTPSCSAFGPAGNSWWYSFTPSSSGSYTISASGPAPTVALYTGSTLGGLSEQNCRFGNGTPFTFAATAGTTYHLRVDDFYGGQFGPVSLAVRTAPDPVAEFFFSPGDPSQFDTVSFFDASHDPGGNSIGSRTWDFGDGSVVTNPDQTPTHRFRTDGDYAVKLTATTGDGRTATRTQTIRVRTHDVAITAFAVPTSARPDRSKSISVAISNARYPERVTVQLLKSIPGNGFEEVGTLTQSVPARSKSRTTDFPFSYTFTQDDAAAGRVTFQAIAMIADARDALPGDNTVIALPTTVRGGAL